MQSHVGTPAKVLQIFPGFPGGLVLHWSNVGFVFGLHSLEQNNKLDLQLFPLEDAKIIPVFGQQVGFPLEHLGSKFTSEQLTTFSPFLPTTDPP